MSSVQFFAPLNGDPARQAVPSLKGYDYQIWRTVEAWLKLREDEILYLECAEDFDLIGPDGPTAVQVKNATNNITLVSEEALDAINHFWDLTARNPEQPNVKMHFLTRGDVGLEKNRPFVGEKGLHVWRRAASGDDGAVEMLRPYLQGRHELSAALRDFLLNASAEMLREKLFRRIVWCTGEPSTDAVRESVEDMTISLGKKKEIAAAFSIKAVPAFFAYCREVATRDEVERRKLTVQRRERVFADATNIPLPPTPVFLKLIQGNLHPMSIDEHLKPFVEALNASGGVPPSPPSSIALKPLSRALSDAAAFFAHHGADGVSTSIAEPDPRSRFLKSRRILGEVIDSWRKQYCIELTDTRLCLYNGHLKLVARDPSTGAMTDSAVWARATVYERLNYTLKAGERITFSAKTDPDRVSSLRWDLDVKIEDGECCIVSTLRNRIFSFPKSTDQFHEREHFQAYMHVVEKLHERWEPVGFVSFNVGESAFLEPVHPESFSIACEIGEADFAAILARGSRIALAYRMFDELKLPLLFNEEYFDPALSEDVIENSIRHLAARLPYEIHSENFSGGIVVRLDRRRCITLMLRHGCLRFETARYAT
ncbi:hypothetical protein EFP18_13315 [Burkholderia glumae]|uniref:hypothetical protein n=1 Tax=Burkholderia glumae TaxID=337 RepID=UPI0021518867|nr:hypothetical protein [Burkholderia glumae]UVS84999.1 hypothetical protein EFP18_13315 [Burkholderia glumae]